MGVTIHYRFLVRHPEVLERMQGWLATLAGEFGMEVRERNSEEHSLLIDPPQCETLDLTFKPGPVGWVCSGSCKTQFSDWRTHVRVAELLRVPAAFCSRAEVYDEGTTRRGTLTGSGDPSGRIPSSWSV